MNGILIEINIHNRVYISLIAGVNLRVQGDHCLWWS